jgi:hypothetical protein
MKKPMVDVEGPRSSQSMTRQIRIVTLLHAAERAGLVPVPILRLHTLAYLSNVLAPVWDLRALDGRLLKRRGGPFYPDFQWDLDHLVGRGVVVIRKIAHILDEDKRWRLEGQYRLNETFAARIVDAIQRFAEERRTLSFIQELVFAVSSMPDQDIDNACSEDATYTDPLVDIGTIIDFAGRGSRNYSLNAAEYFGTLTAAQVQTTPGEKLHLFVSHLRRRLQHAGS